MRRVPTRSIITKIFIYIEGGCLSIPAKFEAILSEKLFFKKLGVFLGGEISISQTMAASGPRKKLFESLSKTV